MFEIRLMIGLCDQNLAEDFRFKSDLTWQNNFFWIMETQVYFNTILVFTFLEHIFVFFFGVRYKVFSVYCTLSKTDKSSINKVDFRFKWDFMRQKPFIFKT